MPGVTSAVGRRLSWVAVGVLWAAIVVTVIDQLRTGYSKSSWQLSEWLINYRGGFVRRGLAGEVLLRLNESIGLDPYVAIVVVSLTIYAAACIVAIWAASRSLIPFAIIPMSFALGFPAFANQWMRKDVLLVLLLGLAVWSVRLRRPGLRLAVVNLLAILAVLNHEGFVFVGLPAIVIALAVTTRGVSDSWGHRAVRSTLAMAPTLVVGALVYLSKGDPSVARSVWVSWNDVTFPPGGFAPPEIPGGGPQAAIESLGWTTFRGFEITRGALVTSDFGIPAFLAWAVTIAWVFVTALALLARPASMHDESAVDRRAPALTPLAVSGLLITQFLCTLPLYVIGLDYGRWIFLWIAAVLAIVMTVPRAVLESTFGEAGAGGTVRRWLGDRGAWARRCERLAAFVGRAPNRAWAFIVLSLVLAVPPAYWEAYATLTPIYLLVTGVAHLF